MATAAASLLQSLLEEVTCSICLQYYTNPMTTKCGHNFCLPCISKCSEGAGTALPCPQCRELCPQGDLRPNRQLQSMVELILQLPVQQKTPSEEGLCEVHQEKLKLFCEEDQKLICVVCRESSAHRLHAVRPIKEAVEEYKHALRGCLPSLWVKMEAVHHCKRKGEGYFKGLRNKVEAERRKIKTEFEGLRQLLKVQEQTLHQYLDELSKKILLVANLNMVKLLDQTDALKNLITEIEKKCEQPAEELLELKELDSGYCYIKLSKEVSNGGDVSPEQKYFGGLLLQDIRSTLDRCGHVLVTTPEVLRKNYKVFIKLDADTAHKNLNLSEDDRRLTWSDTRRQPLLDNPKRFTVWCSVLGKEGFSSGRHYWELQLLQDEGWTVGVAQESVSRKSKLHESPAEGVLAVQRHNGQYRALASPPSSLFPRQPPVKLGLFLDYDVGRLSVFNANTMETLFTFTDDIFTGQLYPYFSLWPGTDLYLL